MQQDWRADVQRIHETVVKAWPVYSPEDQRFLTLALGGEVGELQNLVKKLWRGDFEQSKLQGQIAEELADIRIYLELVGLAFGVDLDAAVAVKLPELYRRWPEAQP